MQLVRFCDVTEAFARKEGEGDLSPEYWKKEHQRFFSSEGHFSEDMELIAEEFEVVEGAVRQGQRADVLSLATHNTVRFWRGAEQAVELKVRIEQGADVPAIMVIK